MITLHIKRMEAGLRNRISGVIWVGLSIVTILAMTATGYQEGLAGKRSPLATRTLVLAFSAIILLIADLDSDRKGFLNVSQQVMIDLQEKMNLPGGLLSNGGSP